jgi:hypothetical protein
VDCVQHTSIAVLEHQSCVSAPFEDLLHLRRYTSFEDARRRTKDLRRWRNVVGVFVISEASLSIVQFLVVDLKVLRRRHLGTDDRHSGSIELACTQMRSSIIELVLPWPRLKDVDYDTFRNKTLVPSVSEIVTVGCNQSFLGSSQIARAESHAKHVAIRGVTIL